MNKINEIPRDWKWVKIIEVCDIYAGYGFPKNLQGAKSGIYPFYKVGDISRNVQSGNKYLSFSENCINEDTLKHLKAKLFPKGTVVFAKIGESLKLNRRAIINQVGLVDNNAIGLKAKNIISDLYLYYFLTTIKLEDLSRATTVPSVRKSDIEEISFPMPPLPTQQAIVSKIEELFSDLDKGIENLKIVRQQLKVYRQSVLKWAFEGKYSNATLTDLEISPGWKTVKLKEICKIMGGVTKGKDFKGKPTINLPYLRVANVQDGYLDLREIKTIEVLPTDREKYQLIYGDILYTEGGDKDKLGRGTMWKEEVKDCIHQNHIFRARPLSNDINPKYVALYSQTRAAKDYFIKHGKQTTNLASINLTILSQLPLPICSLENQDIIVQEIESRLSVADKMEETINQSLLQSESLRQSILKKAFEGKLVQ